MACAPESLWLDADAAGNVFPFAVLGFDELAELFRRIALRQHIALVKGGAHGRRLQRGHGSLLDFVDNGSRRGGRRPQSITRQRREGVVEGKSGARRVDYG